MIVWGFTFDPALAPLCQTLRPAGPVGGSCTPQGRPSDDVIWTRGYDNVLLDEYYDAAGTQIALLEASGTPAVPFWQTLAIGFWQNPRAQSGTVAAAEPVFNAWGRQSPVGGIRANGSSYESANAPQAQDRGAGMQLAVALAGLGQGVPNDACGMTSKDTRQAVAFVACAYFGSIFMTKYLESDGIFRDGQNVYPMTAEIALKIGAAVGPNFSAGRDAGWARSRYRQATRACSGYMF